jgi:hypothetical protein
MAARMAFLLQNGNAHWRFLAVSVILLWSQVLANAFVVISTQDNPSLPPRIVIEINTTCNGMCGTETAWRFRLLEDATAEYLTSKSNAYDPPEDRIMLKKRMRLTKDEYDQFINLADSSRFRNAALQYDFNSLVDFQLISDVSYAKIGTIKKIYLRNYFPNVKSADLPDEVRQLVDWVYELCEMMRKSGT